MSNIKGNRPMAASVEVYRKNIVARYGDVVLGTGKGVYELRDFDPELDIPMVAEQAQAAQGVSLLTLDLGKRMGEVSVNTRTHDTLVERDAWGSTVRLGDQRENRGVILFDRHSQFEPEVLPIRDRWG